MSTVPDQDLLSPELTEDPFAYYAELRASDPVHWAPASKAWLPPAAGERDGRVDRRAGGRTARLLRRLRRRRVPGRLAYPLPAAVIARMMGVPQQDRGMFQHWSDELALVAFGRAGGQDRAGRYARALAGVRELQEYLAGLIERRRREPGEGMISLLCNAIVALDRHPAELARLRADPSLVKILGRLGDIQVSGEVTWRPNIASRAVTGLRISYE